MCVPHGATGYVSNGYVKEEKPRKLVQKVSQEHFEKGDPDFIDERKTFYEPKKQKESFFASLFK